MSFITNTLFHFTDSIEILKSILTYGFVVSYSDEKESVELNGWPKNKYTCYPMVCFCDIPLTSIDKHTEKYGEYGIGLSKEWALRKGLNPVFYQIPHSQVGVEIAFSGKELASYVQSSPKEFMKVQRPIAKIFNGQEALSAFTKVYSNGDILYYEEREWRYIKKPTDVQKEYAKYLNQTEHHQLYRISSDSREGFNEILIENVHDLYKNRKTLLYDITDIKYLIIPSISELEELIRSVKEIKGDKLFYTQDQINVLISKIITLEEIREDF